MLFIPAFGVADFDDGRFVTQVAEEFFIVALVAVPALLFGEFRVFVIPDFVVGFRLVRFVTGDQSAAWVQEV